MLTAWSLAYPTLNILQEDQDHDIAEHIVQDHLEIIEKGQNLKKKKKKKKKKKSLLK